MTEEFIETERPNYVVEFIKRYFDRYPDMFRKDPGLTNKFLNNLKGDRIKLRKYPDVVYAMYEGKEDQIPEDMLPEANPQKSPMLDRYD